MQQICAEKNLHFFYIDMDLKNKKENKKIRHILL